MMLTIKDHISDVPDGRDISFEKDPAKKGQSKKNLITFIFFVLLIKGVKNPKGISVERCLTQTLKTASN